MGALERDNLWNALTIKESRSTVSDPKRQKNLRNLPPSIAEAIAAEKTEDTIATIEWVKKMVKRSSPKNRVLLFCVLLDKKVSLTKWVLKEVWR